MTTATHHRESGGTAAPSPRATRIESLFHLVRVGSSAQVRENAAERLGEIALQSPVYCRSISKQVRLLVVDADWDVRVAAAKCLRVIARSLADSPLDVGQNAALCFARASFAGREASCPRLNFRTVSIETVLREGAPLLRSGGEEYEYQSDLSEDQRRLQAVRQRQLLVRRICGASADAGLWRTGEDSLAQQMLPRLNSEHVKELADDIEASEATNDAEPSKLRDGDNRKRAGEMLPLQQRAPKKVKSEDESAHCVEDSGDDGGDRHVDVVARLVVDLFESIFDSKWEVRHGGLAALRHVFLSSDLISGLTQQSSALRAAGAAYVIDQWLEESLMRCICVLALDQFVDYSADGSVAPVRDLAAQVFGILLGSLQDRALLQEYLLVLRKSLTVSSWHSTHGGLLGIKYLLQAHAAHATELAPLVIDDVVRCLEVKQSDSEEDVVVVASEILGDLVTSLDAVKTSIIHRAVQSLWSIVTTARAPGGIVSSTAIEALRAWYSHPSLAIVLRGYLDGESTWRNISHIVPLLHHHGRAVRIATAACIEALLAQIDLLRCQKQRDDATASPLQYVLPHLLLQILRDEDEQARTSVQAAWKAVVIHCAASGTLPASVEGSTLQWVELLWSLEHVSVLNTQAKRDPVEDDELDASSTLSLPKKENLAARVAFADAIGFLSSWLPVESQSFKVSVQRTKDALASLLGEEQCGALLFIARWAFHAASQTNSSSMLTLLREEFGEAVDVMAKRDWLPLHSSTVVPASALYYAELTSSLKRVIRMQARLVEVFASAGIHVLKALAASDGSASPQVCSSIAAKSRQVAEMVAQYPFKTLMAQPLAYEQAHFCRQDMFLVDEVIQQASAKTRARVQGVGSCAYCALLVIPPKKSGFLVKSLMESIKTEENVTFRVMTAETLARFVVSQLDIQLKCVTKIITNLCNSAVALAFQSKGETTTQIEESAAHMLRIRVEGAETALQSIVRASDSFKALPILPAAIRRGWGGTEGKWTDRVIQENAHLVTILVAALPEEAKRSGLEWIVEMTDLVGEAFDGEHTRRVIGQAVGKVCGAYIGQESTGENYWEVEVMVVLYDKLFAPRVVDFDQPHRLSSDHSRTLAGSIIVLDRLVAELRSRLTPYVPSLLHFAMKAMHAPDVGVRSMAAKAFADLVPLLPLQMDLLKPQVNHPKLNKLLHDNQSSRSFLESLLQGKAIRHVSVAHILAKVYALRDYQQHGVDWLTFLAENSMGGVLADDMGLGKTLQVLAAIATWSTRESKRRPSLIVCPPIIVHHWISEAKRCFPGVFGHIVDYSGPAAQRKAQQKEITNSSQPSLVVTTYSVVRTDRERLQSMGFEFVVLDEAHLIRNPKSALFEAVCSLEASHRFVLSGTPLQNHVGDLWSLFSFLMPGYLGEYTDFRREFELPITRSRERGATPKQKEQAALAINSLHQRVLPFILRRTKDEVLKELPPKIISNILLPLTPLQKRLYNAASTAQNDGSQSSLRANSGAALTGVLRNLHLLKKICVHPALVKDEEEVWTAATVTEKKRMNDWKASGKMIGLHDLLVESCDLGRADSSGDDDDGIPAGGNHRCLVFAHLKETLDLIQEMLRHALPKVTFLRLDGQTPVSKRQNAVNKFNDDPSIDLLLLTTSVGGLGLTLTGADTVIFIEHSWNPFVDLQAMDRAHRIGQKKTVRVFRLIMEGSLEEHIMDLQAFKEHVASSVVTSTEASTSMNANTTNVLQLLQTSSTAVKAQEAAALEDAKAAKRRRGEEPGAGIPGVAVELLNQIGDLWDQSQYDSLAFPTDR